MRLTIVRMISSSSLAAFSQSNAVPAASRTSPVRQVRSQGTDQQATSSAAQLPPNKTLGSLSAAPARIMPRGSLLDLSV